MRASRRFAVCVLFAALAGGCSKPGSNAVISNARYDDLTALFKEWRGFQPAKLVDGVPDYRSPAMATQKQELANFQRRLAAIDPVDWPIPKQVDYQIVRAEMNGLDFDHRVLSPWTRDPSFYITVFGDESDQPAREGNYARGAVELWKYHWPLEPASVTEIKTGLAAVRALLDQAQNNLSGDAKDLWTYAVGDFEEQSATLAGLAAKLTDPSQTDLLRAAETAKEATDKFVTWLRGQLPFKTGPSGVGIDNYNWYLKNVELLPYTWRDEVTLMERELARARASLALEEARNAYEPPAAPIADATEYDRRAQAAVTDYMAFLKDRNVMTIEDWMDGAIRAHVGRFSAGPREFFGEVDHYDPQVMRTHGYHWFDKAQMVQSPHSSEIRRNALLYNIFITRTEGHATAWEELMLEAGMFDKHPRSRELIYILIAQRAARALGDLRMHARQATLEDAAAWASANTPRGWLSLKGKLVRGEQHLYLRQPAYGTSYLIGKNQIERLIAERHAKLGSEFTLKRFMDEFNRAGLIPISLIRWELTGAVGEDIRGVW